MVKDFLRRLVLLVAAIFLICLVFCPLNAIKFSNEIVEGAFQSKAVWVIALAAVILHSTKKKALPALDEEENDGTGEIITLEAHEIVEVEYDDETLISPR